MKPLIKKIILWAALLLQIMLIFSFSFQNAEKSTVLSRWVTDNFKTEEEIEQDVVSRTKEDGSARYHESVTKAVASGEYSRLQYTVRKFAHILLFFVLGIIIMLLLKTYGIKGSCGWAVCVMFGMAIGFFDETIQLFIKGRAGLLSDVFIDTAGVAAAAIVFFIGGLIYEKIKIRRAEMDS